MQSLTGKVALVTGSSLGIGRATALALAAAGADVTINYPSKRDEAEEVATLCRTSGVRARVQQADAGNQAEVEKLVADTVAEFGRLDIAVANAAYSERGPFWEIEMAEFRRTIEVTMWGPYYLLRAATRQMISQGDGGSVVLISSPHAYTPVPNAMPYNMAKAAISHMGQTAATELLSHRIRVNMMVPGWIDTPGERKYVSDEDIYKQAAGLPWGRLGKPEEIARGVVFMCDPASDYMTGSIMTIDGGISLPWWAKEGFRRE
jgi:glucose 1-dehydrogenase